MKERKYFKVKSKNGQNDPDGSSGVKCFLKSPKAYCFDRWQTKPSS